MNERLTIVIVTFQSSSIIGFCLQKLNREKYEVIVVDNNSQDNTTQVAEQFLPQSNIIKLNKNSGFGRANNVGLRKVKTEYALVLNPDAFMEEKDIETVLSIMDKNHQIAIAGAVPYNCKINDTGEIEIASTPTISLISNGSDFDFTRFITGAGMFMRVEIFKKIGFFNEEFFLYCEDNEICKRVIKKGYKNALIKTTKLLHCSRKSSSDSANPRIFWHRFGWSKAFYIAATRGVIVGKLAALRIGLKYFFLTIRDYNKTSNATQINRYAMRGAFAYLFGIKAFDKNGNPRLPK